MQSCGRCCRRKEQAMVPKKERAVVLVLAFLITALICTALLAPFVLAVRFGEGWLALNYITVPAYLVFAAWGDLRKTAGRRGRRPLQEKREAGRHD